MQIQLHLQLFRPLAERITFSPPAFGPVRLPGSDFTPWQCALAEEAPRLASTVYRESVDRADFESTVDETGQLSFTKGTESTRRYFPHNDPPKALGYLKASVKALNELKLRQYQDQIADQIEKCALTRMRDPNSYTVATEERNTSDKFGHLHTLGNTFHVGFNSVDFVLS